MRLDPQSIINSRIGVGLALGFGRALSPRLGIPLARGIADWISRRRRWSLVRAARLNQWVARGCRSTPEELDLAVRDTFRHTARCIYDLYHNLHNLEAAEKLIRFTPEIDAVIEGSRSEGGQGLLVVGVHMSNFDMVAQAAALRGLRAQAISVPRPNDGYEWQNELRVIAGLEITPASKEALRKAHARLEAGGVVITGMDRPVEDSRYRPRFFGHPSAAPVAYIQLALRAKVPVRVAAAIKRADGRYSIEASEPVWLKPYGDRQAEIVCNAEMLLEIAEDYIRQAPEQWAMFFPLWPDLQPPD